MMSDAVSKNTLDRSEIKLGTRSRWYLSNPAHKSRESLCACAEMCHAPLSDSLLCIKGACCCTMHLLYKHSSESVMGCVWDFIASSEKQWQVRLKHEEVRGLSAGHPVTQLLLSTSWADCLPLTELWFSNRASLCFVSFPCWVGHRRCIFVGLKLTGRVVFFSVLHRWKIRFCFAEMKKEHKVQWWCFLKPFPPS